MGLERVRPSSIVVACLVLMVVVAGCSGGNDKATPAPQVDFSELDLQATASTGILRGLVVDDAVRPVAGAHIVLNGLDAATRQTDSNEQGAFGFDGLPPGDYFVVANKTGFVQTQQSTTVVAGVAEPPIVKVLLQADPSTRPYVDAFVLAGFIQCSVRPLVLAEQCGVTDDDVVHAEYDLARPPTWIQSEMVWDSTQALGDELSLSIRCLPSADPAEKCPEGQRGIVRSEGHSPQVARINQTLAATWALGGAGGNPLTVDLFAYGRSDLDVYNESTVDGAQKPVTGHDCMWWPNVLGFPFPDGTCMRATGPGLIINQKVDVYSHSFYGYLPPESWQFSVDGAPPLPPA